MYSAMTTREEIFYSWQSCWVAVVQHIQSRRLGRSERTYGVLMLDECNIPSTLIWYLLRKDISLFLPHHILFLLHIDFEEQQIYFTSKPNDRSPHRIGISTRLRLRKNWYESTSWLMVDEYEGSADCITSISPITRSPIFATRYSQKWTLC